MVYFRGFLCAGQILGFLDFRDPILFAALYYSRIVFGTWFWSYTLLFPLCFVLLEEEARRDATLTTLVVCMQVAAAAQHVLSFQGSFTSPPVICLLFFSIFSSCSTQFFSINLLFADLFSFQLQKSLGTVKQPSRKQIELNPKFSQNRRPPHSMLGGLSFWQQCY
jgi:hypothetical protein